MKKVILFSIVLLLTLAISCNKEESTTDIKSVNSQKSNLRSGNYIPGVIFYEDGWIGWIDPELYDEPLPEVYKEDPKFAGWKEESGGETRIICPKAGENCGRLYIIDPEDGIVFVGVYLLDD